MADVANVFLANTFTDWVNKTNEIVGLLNDSVLRIGESVTGNTTLNGVLLVDRVHANTGNASAPSLRVGPGTGVYQSTANTLALTTNSALRWTITAHGDLLVGSDGGANVGQSANLRPATIFVKDGLAIGAAPSGGSLRIGAGTTTNASVGLVRAEQTWNNASATFTAVRVDVTDTDSDDDSLLLDLQVDDMTQMSVNKTGDVTVAGGITATQNVSANSVNLGSSSYVYFDSRSAIASPSDGIITLSNTGGTGFTRLILGTSNTLGVSLVKSNTTIKAMLGDASALTTFEAMTLNANLVSANTVNSANVTVTKTLTANVAVLTSANVSGTVTATTFSGSGASLTSIPESAITDGSVLARIAGTETITGHWKFQGTSPTDFYAENASALAIQIFGRTLDSAGILRFLNSAGTVEYGRVQANSSGLSVPTTLFATLFSGSGASLTGILESAITDANIFPRISSTEVITGPWTFTPASGGLTIDCDAAARALQLRALSTSVGGNIQLQKSDGTALTNISWTPTTGEINIQNNTTITGTLTVTNLIESGTVSDLILVHGITKGVTPALDNSGNLGRSGRAWNTIAYYNASQQSDERVKTNITDTDLGLNWICSLRPVRYNWISEPEGKPHYGFIAQDFINQAVLDDNDSDHLALRYLDFIAPLVKAVQELSAKVAVLEAKNAYLK